MQRRRSLEQLAIASLDEAGCPAPEQLAAYSLRMVAGTDELIIAAHVRSCPICAADIAALQPPPRRLPVVVAQFLPSAVLAGRRSASAESHVRQYLAADLTIELTIAPPQGDTWRLTGQLLRAGVGVPEQPVTMRSGRRRYQRQSDSDGFFTFDALAGGTYTLVVRDNQSTIEIRAIVLHVD